MKQRTRPLSSLRKALSNPGNVGWILIFSFAGVVVYAATIAYFVSRTGNQQRVEFSETPSATPSKNSSGTFTVTSSNTSSFAVILTSIDPNTKKIAFDLEGVLSLDLVDFLVKGKERPEVCISFSYFLPERVTGNSYERMAGGSIELVALNAVPSYSLSKELQTKGGQSFRGSGAFSFDSDQRYFPLDRIPLQISLYAKCFRGPEPLTPNDVKSLFIENRILDYQLTAPEKSGPDPNITLRRTPFLIFLAILLLLLAFVSALVIIVEARTKPLDLKLLTYFIGLWGIRSILLTPVQNVRAFPTLIEVTILFLFGFTVGGIGLMRFLATRTKPKKSGWLRYW